MEPAEIFESVRAAYFDAFVKAVEVQTSGYAEVLIQPCLNDDKSEVPRTPSANPFHVPMRQDMVPVKDGVPQAVLVVKGPEPEFLPLAWEFDGGFQLALGPFTWDDCRVVVFGLPPDADLSPIVEWFQDGADLLDEEDPDEETGLRLLAHHVHQVDDPHMPEGTTVFELDMGTAPADALSAFVDLLAQMGATIVVIGDYQQEEGADETTDETTEGGG